MIEYWFHVHQPEGQSRLQRVLELPSAHDDPRPRAARPWWPSRGSCVNGVIWTVRARTGQRA